MIVRSVRDWVSYFGRELIKKYKKPEPTPTFANKNMLSIYVGIELYNYNFKK